MESNFWAGKKVFVTGHTGFKGSWLSLWLQDMGAIVKGYALEPNTTPNLFVKAKVGQNMDSEIGDITDLKRITDSMIAFNPEVLIHMAAQPLVRLSYKEPVLTYATNVMGTVNVLEVARKCSKLKAIVSVTTDKCYENKEWHWGYRENEAMGGYDPYSNSKGCSELVTSAFANVAAVVPAIFSAPGVFPFNSATVKYNDNVYVADGLVDTATSTTFCERGPAKNDCQVVPDADRLDVTQPRLAEAPEIRLMTLLVTGR